MKNDTNKVKKKNSHWMKIKGDVVIILSILYYFMNYWFNMVIKLKNLKNPLT